MKWYHWVVLGVLAAILVGVGYIATYPGRVNREVESKLAALKASGAPTCTADLKSNVPNDRNAALVYLKAFKLLSDKRLSHEAADGRLSRETADALDELSSGKGTAKAALLVKKYAPAFRIAEEASKLPECSYPIDWSRGVMSASLLHYTPARAMVRLYCMKSLLAVRGRRPDEAINGMAMAFKVSNSLRNEPTLIGSLTRMATAVTASKTLKDVLHDTSISGSSAKSLYDLLSTMDFYSSQRKALEGERVMGIEVEGQIRHGDFDALDPDLGEARKKQTPDEKRTLAFMFGTWASLDELYYLSQMQSMVDASGIPLRELKKRPRDLKEKIPSYALISSLLVPSFGRSYTHRDQAVAEIDGDRILLALLAFKDRHHAYPKSLAELRDGLGWKIPQDIFSGKDFHYRRAGKGFFLYSVGPNLKDDGGMQVSGRDIWDKGDMIWKWDR